MARLIRVGLIVVFVVVLTPIQTWAAARPIRVTFLNPGLTGEEFWDLVSNFMLAAAEDLEIELTNVRAERDHLKMIKDAAAQVTAEPRPDYIVLVNEKQAGGPMFDSLTNSGIGLILLSNPLDVGQTKIYGRPREKIPNWLGTVAPDQIHAGRAIAEGLIGVGAPRLPAESPREVLAISGSRATSAATDRAIGLKQVLADQKRFPLRQLVFSNWQRPKAADQLGGLLRRYPDIGMIWAANDPMALGAADAVRAAGKIPGRDILIGGLNWSREALLALRQGTLSVDVGGHFMNGAWALVLIHDHAKGRDFADEGLEFTPPMEVMTSRNVDLWLNKFGDQNWRRIDFSRFSKQRNPALVRYPFNKDAIMAQ